MFRWQNLRPLGICWINDDVIRRLWTNHNSCLSINISSLISSKSRGQISTPTQPFKSWLCSWARRFKTFEKRYFQISAFRKRVETSVVVTFCSGHLKHYLVPHWRVRNCVVYSGRPTSQYLIWAISKTSVNLFKNQCLSCLFDVFHESPHCRWQF